jgi:Ca2+-binding EF-hand superfamily protein
MPELSDEQIEELEEDFDHFDRDRNGRVDFAEFTALLDALGSGVTGEEARIGFAAIDDDHSGTIDFPEFLAWWADR